MVVLAACSGRAPAPARPDPPVGSGSGAGSAQPIATAVTEADCLAMIDHALAIDIQDRPADQRPSADELDKLRTQLHTSMLPNCLEQSREVVGCIRAAATRAAISACGH